jgi:hypothetical protein
LSIEEWDQSISFSSILIGKLKTATRVKEGLMKLHGITDVKDVTGFRCQICPAVFPWPTALGGHMSKAHPKNKRDLKEKALTEQ